MDQERLTEAFGLLADETRVAIVRELALRQGEGPADRELSFAELRERVGTPDSGRFNYHLDKLCDHFVKQTEDGYRLTALGIRIAGAVVGGYYADDSVESGELSRRCPCCEEPLTATYENGLLTIECPDERQISYFASSRLFEGRSLDEAADHLALAAISSMRVTIDGACPECYGAVDWSIEGGDDPTIAFVCRHCGFPAGGPPEMAALYAPDAAAALRDHGLDFQADPLGTLLAVQDVGEVSVDPEASTATVTFPLDGETVDVAMSAEGDSLDVRRVD